jgi:hypothetical protein
MSDPRVWRSGVPRPGPAVPHGAAPDFPEEWTKVALDAFMTAAHSGADNVGALNAIIAALAPLIAAERAEAILDAIVEADFVCVIGAYNEDEGAGGTLLVDGGIELSKEDFDYILSVSPELRQH